MKSKKLKHIDFTAIIEKSEDGWYVGKTAVPDHPLPIFVDHHIFFIINKLRWSY